MSQQQGFLDQRVAHHQMRSIHETARHVFDGLAPNQRRAAFRRLSALASHLAGDMRPADELLAAAVPQPEGGDAVTFLRSVHNDAMLVPQPGTPAFQEWMTVLYEEAQYSGGYQHQRRDVPWDPGSSCLAMLRDWFMATEQQLASGTAREEAAPESSLARRLRVMAGHVPQIADAGLMMTRGTRL